MIIGYTTGVFDLFHIGHVNLLRNAHGMCDKLIVGVSTDELVFKSKGKHPVIPFHERIEVVKSCRYVDVVVPQLSKRKMEGYEHYKFDLMFVGDDWLKDAQWEDFEIEFSKLGAKVIYFPYTAGTSSTIINDTLKRLRAD
jgi:glycerol-3-phosphate cytidylyltransferase